MDYINIGLRSYTIILFISTLSFIAGSNVNCNGKAFHCVNSTHFKICVDLGGGVSTTVDEFLIPCPRNTVCKQYNLFECEYDLTTTLSPVTAQKEVTNEQFQTSVNSVWEQLDITTIFPTKLQQGMELSDNKYNKVNTTRANFTSSFDRSSSDVVIDPVLPSTTKDLNTSSNSNINKTLNISLRIDKELAFSTTESGIDIAQTLPYNVGTTFGTDIGVSSNNNTEISTTLDKKNIDSIKSISSKALNQSSFDLNLMVTERTNPVSGVSELPYLTTVKLLPGNLNNTYLQESIPRKSNITNMIKSDNMSQERKLDPLIIYNKTPRNKSDNNTQYRNTKNDKLNSNTRNDITDEKFINDESHKNSKVNNVMTLELTPQNLAEATTSSYPTYLNTSDAIETFVNEGINITTNMEKLSVNERNDILPISSTLKSEITSEVTIGKVLYLSANEATQVRNGSQIDNLNYMEDELVSTKTSKNQSNPSFLPLLNISLYTVTPVTKTATYDNITVGDYNFKGFDLPVITTTEILNDVTILKPIPDLILKNETLPMSVMMTDLDNNNTTSAYLSSNITAKTSNRVTSLKPSSVLILNNETVVVMGNTDLNNNNTTTVDPSNNITVEISNGVTSLNPSSVLILNNETVVVMGDTDLNNNTTTVDPSNNITAEMSNRVTSLKPSSVLILNNETVIVMGDTDLNNNTSTVDPSNNITAEMSNRVTSLKPSSVLILNNETLVVMGDTDLNNKNTTTADPSNNITVEISNGVTSLKPSSVLILNYETLVVMGDTDLNNNNTTTADPSSNITAEISNEITSLKPSSVLILNNETLVVMGDTDLNNNNTTTADLSSNITAEISNKVTSLKPSSVLILNNETLVVMGDTDLNNNNTTTADPSNNITVEISNGVTSLKPSSVLILNNETVIVMGDTDLNNNSTTTVDSSNNITAEISNGVISLKPSSVLILNNETLVVMGDTDLNNNNTTTADPSNNITEEISNGVTSLKPSSVLILNNETVVVMGDTDLNNNNTTTADPSSNITAEIPNEVTSLKTSSVLILNNETLVVMGDTDLNNNNTTTVDPSNNITAEMSNRVTSLKPTSVLILNNETDVVMGDTDLNNNNTTTVDPSNNITAEMSNRVTSLKPTSVLILNNETDVVMGDTDLNNNNTTTVDPSNNITVEISNGVTSLKPSSVLILNNETVIVMGDTDLNNNSTTTVDSSNNITAEISNGVISLKPSSVLILNNETLVVMGDTDLNNNNTTTVDPSNNITAEMSNRVTSLKPTSVLILNNETIVVMGNTDLNNNNTTTVDPSNNITAKMFNRVTSLKPSSVLISTNETWQKPLMVTVPTDLEYNNRTTTESIHNSITIDISNGVTGLKPISDLISNNETWENPLIVTVDTDLGKNNITTTEPSNSITAEISNGATNLSKSNSVSHIISATSKIQPTDFKLLMVTALSSNSTFINKISDEYETRIESYTDSTTMESLTGTTAFKSAISMDVINNTFAVIDEVADYTVKSDNLKSIDNTSKLESTITTKPSTFFVSNTSGKQSNSENKNVTTEPSESTKKEINKLRGDNKNTSNNDEILDKNGAKNLNLTTPSTKDITIPKLLTVITDLGISPALSITNQGNNITNKNNTITDNSIINNFKDIEVINKSSSVSSYSKSIPNSLTKPLLTDLYKVSLRNFGANISLTRRLDKTTLSNLNNENKELSQIKQNEHAPIHAIRNIEHEGNKTEYLLLNPYKEVTTTAIDVNDSTRTLKGMSFNFSQPSSIVRNNVKRIFFMENATMTSADKNTTPKDFNEIEGSGFNKSYSTTNKLINVNDYKNRSELEISNNPPSGYIIKPLLIEQKPLVKISKSSLHNDNENFSLVTEHRLQGHVSDRINKSKISEINNVNRTEHIAVKNITSSNWRVINKTVATKLTKTFTYDRNISEVKGLTVLRDRSNYNHDLNATNDSSFATNNLLRNTSSQTYSNNKTHQVPSNELEFSRLPVDQDKSKMDTTTLVLKRPTLELIIESDKVTVSEQRRLMKTNRSNGIDEIQLRNEHGYLESTKVGKSLTKNIENNATSSFKTSINNVNNSVTNYGNSPSKQEFTCTNRGKYSDANDCNKFYVCIGSIKPIVGVCPAGTVFSECLKQCTKNITHCIRNNQFKCTGAGRFINILSNNTYFICAKEKSSFIRFTLQCQKGYYLDKYSVKCTPNLINITLSDENNSKNTKELSFHKEMEEISVKSKDVFECEKEGKFKDPQDCRKYYICKKGSRSTFRRKIKQCDSDEVFHRKKKKCVDVESYECDI